MTIAMSISYNSANAQVDRSKKTTTSKTTTSKKTVVVDNKKYDYNVEKNAKVKTVNNISKNYTTVKHNNVTYYVSAGKYYKKVGTTYKLVAAPYGVKVQTLPSKYSTFNYLNALYLLCDGIIYRQLSNNYYETVEPTVGMIVPELPRVNVSQISIGGEIYYEYDNIIYKPVPTVTGIQYKVSGYLD